jgi:hypothetical protein
VQFAGLYGKRALKTLGKRAAFEAAKEATVTYFTYDNGTARIVALEPQAHPSMTQLVTNLVEGV